MHRLLGAGKRTFIVRAGVEGKSATLEVWGGGRLLKELQVLRVQRPCVQYSSLHLPVPCVVPVPVARRPAQDQRRCGAVG